MLTLKEIKNLQDKYNLHAKKRFGQNFLIDQNILQRIIQVANIKAKEVIEVGPGLGSLTLWLLPEVRELTAFEIDKDMIKVLNGEISNSKFKLIEGDFLKEELTWKSKKTLVANLPYYITSDTLFKLFENIDKFDKAIIMIQDEVADRLSAPVGSKQYGKFTISANHFATIKKEFIVKPQSFTPSPKVNSAIITLKFNKTIDGDTVGFLEFVKKSFRQRRKTLFNNWKEIIGASNAKNLILEMGFDPAIRPQNLTHNDYKIAFNKIKTTNSL